MIFIPRFPWTGFGGQVVQIVDIPEDDLMEDFKSVFGRAASGDEASPQSALTGFSHLAFLLRLFTAVATPSK